MYPLPLSKRLGIFFGFLAYFLISYLTIQQVAPRLSQPATLTLPWEDKIPFLPLLIIIYISTYLFPMAIVFMIEKKDAFKKAVTAFFVASIIHYVVFLVFPVELVLRPALSLNDPSLLSRLVALFYRLDKPFNCFPSIHVSFAFLTYFCVKQSQPDRGPFLLVWAIAIALSTLFVKQHYLLDVISAFVLAFLINRFYLDNRSYQSNFNPKS